MAPTIRALSPHDREPLEQLVDGLAEFSAAEKEVARELIGEACTDYGGEYLILVALQNERTGGDRIVGYVCYGDTPMTESTYDVFWVGVEAAQRGQGLAGALLQACESDLRQRNAHLIRIETGSSEGFGKARRFYEKVGYAEEARLKDFYKRGDDLIVFTKRLA